MEPRRSRAVRAAAGAALSLVLAGLAARTLLSPGHDSAAGPAAAGRPSPTARGTGTGAAQEPAPPADPPAAASSPAASLPPAGQPVTWPLPGAFPLTAGLRLPARAPGTCPPATSRILAQTPATHRRTVALTFDDGPGPWTAQVLAVLARHHVHGTFFEIGTAVARDPGSTRSVLASGSLVGNHTWNHPTARLVPGGLDGMAPAAVAAEIDMDTAQIEAVTGERVCFFRGPQGHHKSLTVRSTAAARDLTVTGWDGTAKDFAQSGHADPVWVRRIVGALTGRGDHPILLMHDGDATGYRGNTVVALDQIITWYASRGYMFTDPAGRPFPAPTAG